MDHEPHLEHLLGCCYETHRQMGQSKQPTPRWLEAQPM